MKPFPCLAIVARDTAQPENDPKHRGVLQLLFPECSKNISPSAACLVFRKGVSLARLSHVTNMIFILLKGRFGLEVFHVGGLRIGTNFLFP